MAANPRNTRINIFIIVYMILFYSRNTCPLYSQANNFYNADSINIQSVSLMYDLKYSLSNQKLSIYWDTINVTEKWGIHPDAVNLFEDLCSKLSPLSDKILRQYDELELPIEYMFDFFIKGAKVDTLWLFYTSSNQYWTEETMNLAFRLSSISKYYNMKIDEYCHCRRMIRRSGFYYSKYKETSISISDLERDWESFSIVFGSDTNEAEWRQMAELFAFTKLASINKIHLKSIIDFINKHDISIEKIRYYSEFLDDEYKENIHQLLSSILNPND